MELKREKELNLLKDSLRQFPVVAILGPRQCGKTTLAKQYLSGHTGQTVHFFDLEDPVHLARLDSPMLALESLKGLVVLDEVQRRPEIFPILRVLVDRNPERRFLILGSASGPLLAQSSETLAGRIHYMELSGFDLGLVGSAHWKKLWLRGGFPKSYLAASEKDSLRWRQEFASTFLERDIPNLGIRIPARTLRRFWMMLAHYHGRIFNATELAQGLGMTDFTARRYLDILSSTFMVRQIQSWSYNTKKRLIRRPKIYFRDTGMLHALMSIMEMEELNTHPQLGSSWEGFALEQVIRQLGLKEEEAFFWGVHTGGELDLVFQKKGKLWGVEVKYGDAPKITTSMKSALKELNLAHLWVIYPKGEIFPLDTQITATPLVDLSPITSGLKS